MLYRFIASITRRCAGAAIACALALPLAAWPQGDAVTQAAVASAAVTPASSAATAMPVADAVPAAAAPRPAASAKSGTPIDNPYGIEALWSGSDAIARSVLVLLCIMSAGSWFILATKLLEQLKMNRHARSVDAKFWQAPSLKQGVDALEHSSAYRYIAEAGVAATREHAGLKRHIPLQEWIPMSITAAVDSVHAASQKGLAFLATVGSTSPFVGLFGTVWGIYHALTAIGLSGQASIDKVAGPVGEALIMTAIGLAVAIPAVLAYNWLARRNKAVMDEVREFADELNAVILGAGRAA
jgi:biopolymer transport protein ExbB